MAALMTKKFSMRTPCKGNWLLTQPRSGASARCFAHFLCIGDSGAYDEKTSGGRRTLCRENWLLPHSVYRKLPPGAAPRALYTEYRS